VRILLHEPIAEHVDFFTLSLDVVSIALMGNLNHRRCSRRLQDKSLQLDLLQDNLVCFIG
jgi:hypothetical protein